MRVLINGEVKELRGEQSLDELVKRLDLPTQRVAVELNRIVVRRTDWQNTLINDNDRIEIVHFVGGG
jgi:thiamine biosynthesis protein ThiS